MILRLRNPNAFYLAGIWDLFVGQLGDDKIRALQQLADRDYTGIFIDDRYQAFAVVFLPTSILFEMPQVYYLHVQQDRALREALVAAIRQFVADGGYDRFCTVNRNGRDRGFRRLFQSAGDITTHTYYEFSMTEAGEIA